MNTQPPVTVENITGKLKFASATSLSFEAQLAVARAWHERQYPEYLWFRLTPMSAERVQALRDAEIYRAPGDDDQVRGICISPLSLIRTRVISFYIPGDIVAVAERTDRLGSVEYFRINCRNWQQSFSDLVNCREFSKALCELERGLPEDARQIVVKHIDEVGADCIEINGDNRGEHIITCSGRDRRIEYDLYTDADGVQTMLATWEGYCRFASASPLQGAKPQAIARIMWESL